MPRDVVIVGVGALGSHVAMFLRNVDARLRLVDFDRVEQKNTTSQFHGRPHVGKLKTESLKQTFGLLWGTKLEALPVRLSTDNAEQLLKADLVIDCLDNGAARRVLQVTVRKHGTPCLHGALAADGGFGRAIWDESFVIDEEASAGAATCEEGAHLPFIGIVAAYIASAAEGFLRDGRKRGFSISPVRSESV